MLLLGSGIGMWLPHQHHFRSLLQLLASLIPIHLGAGFTLRPLFTYSTNSLFLPPHLREEIEASKATHNTVNFWETLPFSTRLSRQTQTHKKPRKCQSYDYCKDRVTCLLVVHLTGWLRNWQAFDSMVMTTTWLKTWYTRNREKKWAHPQCGPSLPKSNYKGRADWSTETTLNFQDQHRFRQLFNRYPNLKRINPVFSFRGETTVHGHGKVLVQGECNRVMSGVEDGTRRGTLALNRREQSCSVATLFIPHWKRRAAAFHFPAWVPVTPTPQTAAPLGKEKNSGIITSSLLQYPNRLLPSSPVRTNENVSLQKEKSEWQDTISHITSPRHKNPINTQYFCISHTPLSEFCPIFYHNSSCI